MSEFIYRQFEDRFRGSKDDVQKRQAIYLPVIAYLKKIYPTAPLLDLGCGRGEWLELSSKNGWQATGIDLDQGMIEHCHTLGLKAEHVDALTHLSSLAAESMAVVTAMHVAEHVPFDVLQDMIKEILRVLKPGGIMILETPNPENIVVGTCSFYIDPSHQKPLPPDLLVYLAESTGFNRLKAIRLNESADFRPVDISMKGILYGVSPDYALIAQKDAAADIIGSVAPWEELESRGCSLFDASVTFDIALHRHLDRFATNEELDDMSHRVDEIKEEQQELIIKYQQELLEVYNSKSWRVTEPLRRLMLKLGWLKEGITAWVSFVPGSRPRRIMREVALTGKQYLQEYPAVKALTLRALTPFPAIKKHLKLLGAAETCTVDVNSKEEICLTPGAREIYKDIKEALAKEKKI